MQRDEEMLRRVCESSRTSLIRVYRWNRPTVSLGYFQKSDAQIDPRLVSCPRVKRVTGGGAILHDDELTYSVALPDTHPVRTTPIELYELVHSAVIRLLSECGAESVIRKDVPGPGIEASGRDDQFLCFLRADPRDVVVRQHKILGSAQRRRKGNILQHGSILLRASPLTPEIPGIADLNSDFQETEFCRKLPRVIATAVADQISEKPFPTKS